MFKPKPKTSPIRGRLTRLLSGILRFGQRTDSKKQRTVSGSLLFALRSLLFVTALTGVFLYTRVGTPVRVQAATSSNINFQARLLSSAGTIAPDGTYNVEFKLYDSSAAGASAQGACVGGGTDDCLWVETRTGANKVTVKNGYLSVHLGDVTSFPAINWDQDIYLTMRIGGTGTPAWDTEMSPRLKLTAVPFAFRSAGLAVNDGANNGSLTFGSVTNNPDIKLPNIAGTNNVLLQTGTTLLTQGSIPFVDANGRLTQDNGSFYFDDTNNRLGVGNANPGTVLDISGAFTIRGMSAPAVSNANQGVMYFDSTSDTFMVSGNGNAYYEICTNFGNCAGAGGGVTATGGAGNTNYLPVFSGSNTLVKSYLLQGATTLTLDDNKDFVADAVNNTFIVDAQNNRVGIGTLTPTELLSVGPGSLFTVAATGNVTTAGDLAVNGGDITSTGALNITPGGALTVGATGQTTLVQGSATSISSSGAGNDITLTSADQIILNAGSSIELQDNTNVTGSNTFTVGSGLTTLGGGLTLTGTTNINTSGTAATTIGNGTAALTLQGSSIVLNSATLSRTAAGTTTLNLVDGSNTSFAITNSGAGVANLTVDGSGTFATGLTVSAGGISVTGNSTITGALSGLSALTSSGTITFSGLSTAGIVTNSAAGVLGTVSSVPVTNGGTGANTFTANGILYGNGTGAVQVTGAAANSVLVTNGSNIPSLSQTLPTAVQGNITSTGALNVGSITSGFGAIEVGADPITTTGTITGGTLGVTGLATFSGGLSVINGQQLTNAGSTLFTSIAVANVAAGGNIGTAAATVDVATTFDVNQTTAGQTLTLPTPTSATSGRIAFVNNTGTASFTMYGSTIAANKSNTFIWNGTTWITTVSLAGNTVGAIGTIDSQTKSADGAVISSNALYLQTADTSFPGLVSTGLQTFAGAKTFNGQIVAGAGIDLGTQTLQGTTAIINFTNFDVDASGNGDFAGTLTAGTADAFQVSAAGAVTAVGVNSGTGLIQGTGGLTVSGATDINTSGTANTNIGNATGTFSLTSNALNITTTGAISGVSTLSTSGAITVGTLGLADSDAVICRNTSNQLASCNSTFATTTDLQGYVQFSPASAQSDASANASIFINDTGGGNLLQLQSGGVNRFAVDDSGNTSIAGTLTASGNVAINATLNANNKLQINTAATADAAAQAVVSTGGTSNKGVVIQGVSGQTASLFEAQDSAGGSVALITASGSVQSSQGFQVNSASAQAGYFSRVAYVESGTVSQYDVVVYSNTTGGLIQTTTTTTLRDPRVYGIKLNGGASTAGQGYTIVLAGNTQVNVDSAAVAIGDQLVTSSTAGRATVDNSATTGIIGIAATAKAGGSNGTVGIMVRPVGGQTNPTFTGNVTVSGATGLTVTNATSTGTLAVSGAGTFTGLATFNGGLTVETGDTFTFNGDAFTDLTGTGLTLNGSTLETVLGINVDLASEVTGTLAVGSGGTGATSLTGILLGNGTSPFTALTTSAGIAGAISDETGTGSLVFSASPTFTGTITAANVTAAGTINLNTTGSGTTTIGNTSAALTLQGTSLIINAPIISRTAAGATTFDLVDTADTTFALTNSGTGVANLTVDGSGTFSGALNISGVTTLSGNLLANGNTTIGNAASDRLTITAQIAGASPFAFQGATDNGFSTTFAFSDPTANNTITFGDETGIVCTTAVSAACSAVYAAAGGSYVSLQPSTPGTAQTGHLNINGTAIVGVLSVANSATISGDLAVNGGDITSTGALNITPGGALTIGVTGQTATLQGTVTTITSNGAGNDIVINSADTIELQDNTNITGDLDVSGAINAGTANAFQVTTGGALTAVGVNSGTGLIQGTGGLTVVGTTAINTTGTANTSIGNATGSFSLTSAGLNVTTAGAVSGVTTLDASGAITLGGDTNLYRSAANTLRTDDGLVISGGYAQIVNGSGTVELQMNNGTVQGYVALATGATPSLSFSNGVTNFNFLSSGQLELPATGSTGGILIGADANLYRSAANILRTDDAFVAVGINSGTGLIQGTGGLTVTGTTAINTTGTANTSIGNTTGTFTLDSAALDVSAAGAISGATGITSSGTITFSGLTADRLVATTTGGQLTNTISAANLAASVTGTTGTGNLVFSASPTFTGTVTTAALSATTINASGLITASVLGTADTDAVICRNTSNQLATCNSTFATTGSLAGYVQFAPASAQTDATTNNSIFINKTGASGNLLVLQNNGNNRFVVDGSGNVALSGSLDVQSTIVNSQGNVVINDTVDLGSATTGLNVTTAGVLSDIDSDLVLNDQLNLGSATTGLLVTTAGVISDIDGTTVSVNDNLDVAGTLFAGTGDAFQVSVAGAVTAVGVNSGTGLLQGTGGLTLTGTTAINTTGTANTAIGNATGTFTLDSAALDISAAGVISGATGLTSSGTITFSGLTANRLVATTTGGQLTNTIAAADLLSSVTGTTGTGNLVFSASPTFTGTVTVAALNASGNVDIDGALTVGSAGQLVVDASGNIDTTGNVEGAVVNATTGFRVNGAATTGNYLRGDGTNFVSSALLASDLSGTIFNTAGDTGTGTVTAGETVNVQGGTNGIDTALSGDTFTLNLDTTEIGTTTFGAGSGFTWTFDAGATDPTIAFASDALTVTAASTTLSGDLAVNGGDLTSTTSLNVTASSGALTLTSTGAGNDIILNSADTIELQDNTNVTGNLSVTGTGTFQTSTATQDRIIVSVAAAGAARFDGTITNADLTANRTYTLPNLSGTLAVVNASQTFTSAQTFRGITNQNATATDDQIALGITTGGAARFTGTITNADLTAMRTYTLPDVTGTFITTGNLTSITTVGTITAGTWNGSSITDAYLDDAITISSAGSVDWTALTNYPTGCTAGQAVTAVGDTLTCGTFASSDTTYTAGNDLDLSGTTFNIESQLDFVSTINQTGANLTLQTTTSGNIVLNSAGTVELQDNTNVTGNLDVSGSFAAGTSNAFQVSSAGVLTFSGVGTDITTGTNEDLTLVANGSGSIILNDVIVATNSQIFSNVAIDITTGTDEDLQLFANGTGSILLNDIVIGTGSYIFSNVTTDITTGTNEDLSLQANGTGSIVLNDAIAATGTMTFGGVTTDITTAANEDLTIVANGTGVIDLNDTVRVGVLAATDTDSYAVCRDASSGQLAACDVNTIGKPFLQGGNTFGAGAILGTNDSQPLYLETNNSTRLSILADGNVGIGDTTPAALLTVGNGDLFQVAGSTGNITTAGDLAVNGGDITSTGALTVTPAAGSDVNFALSGTGDLRVNTSQFVVEGGTGHVGIGASDPGYNLDIRAATPIFHIQATSASQSAGMQFLESDNNGVRFTYSAVSDAFIIEDFSTNNDLAVFARNGTVTFAGLTADRLVATTTGGQLTNTISAANLAASVTGTTGTGNLVFSASPTFTGTVTTAALSATTINASGLITATTLGTADTDSVLCINTSNQIAACNSTFATTGGAGNVFLAPTSAQADTSTNNSIFINKTGASGNLIQLQTAATDQFIVSYGGNGTFTGDLAVNGGDITSTGALNISSATTNAVTLDSGTTGGVNVGTGANSKTVTIGNTTGTTGVVINTGSGGVSVNSSNITFTEVTGTRTLGVQTRTTNVAGTGLTISAGAAGAGGGAFQGGVLTLQGGAAGGTGNANGGAVTLIGGAGTGTGTQGLVNLSTTAFTSASVQTFGSAGTFAITAGNVDLYSTLPITASTTGVTVTVPDPGQSVIGRVIYISARSGSSDFTLRLNSARTPIDIAMKANSTATLIWNGTDWTAAGASSSTDLQSAYNNTLTSAGGAEIVLNPSGGAADGFTIRNNGTTPIVGGIFEVQSSIGTNFLSVNNFGTELAANGGSENSSTFATDWTAAPAGGTVTRTTTAGQFVTGLAGVQVVTAGTNYGVRNNLSGNPAVSTTYQVSFTGKLSSGTFSTLQVLYSRDGGTDLEACTNYSTQTLVTSDWAKVTCTITTDATTATNPDLIIRQTDATARTFWIDNLSFIRNDSSTQPSNVQVGGGINGGQVTLFTLDRSSAPPVANGNTTYLGSMYYDTTTGRIQCYEADGWGACGSAPDNIITLTPEYSGAVLNGTGIGTMTADFCANQAGVLTVGSLCASGNSRQFYKWTSPQATQQTYSIYVSFKLPNTFKTFNSDSTITLTALTDNTTNGAVTYEAFRSSGSAVTACGSETAVTSTVNTWQTVGINGNETSCGFVGGDNIIFKINVKASNNATVYVENLNFTYTNN